jgi:hypothetical protein
MENKRLSALALIIIGLIAVNFFYLSDLLFPRGDDADIIIGWKSLVAIAIANLVALIGAWRVTDGGDRD